MAFATTAMESTASRLTIPANVGAPVPANANPAILLKIEVEEVPKTLSITTAIYILDRSVK